MMFKSIVLFSSLCLVVLAADYVDDGADAVPVQIVDKLVGNAPTFVENELEYRGRKNHTTFFGKRLEDDRFIFTADAKITFSSFGSGSSTLDIQFLKEANIRNATITRIEVADRIANYRSGQVSIPAGGVGHDYATLRFKTQGHYPLDFLIYIYGLPQNKRSHE